PTLSPRDRQFTRNFRVSTQNPEPEVMGLLRPEASVSHEFFRERRVGKHFIQRDAAARSSPPKNAGEPALTKAVTDQHDCPTTRSLRVSAVSEGLSTPNGIG